jgi:hypothetical protein
MYQKKIVQPQKTAVKLQTITEAESGISSSGIDQLALPKKK